MADVCESHFGRVSLPDYTLSLPKNSNSSCPNDECSLWANNLKTSGVTFVPAMGVDGWTLLEGERGDELISQPFS